MKQKKVVVLLAEGFEEIEAVSIVDVLRRAEQDVCMAAVADAATVSGAHGIVVSADAKLSELNSAELDMVVLPGGMPGAINLAENAAVRTLLFEAYANGGIVAAICAGPLALHAAGLLNERRVTAYPSVRDQLAGAVYTGHDVECDQRIITGKGPGSALIFSVTLVRELGFAQRADEIAKGMLCPFSVF